jgi:hypothetical protein
LNRLYALRERLHRLCFSFLALDARELMFERAQNGVRLCAAPNSGQLRREFDDARVSNLEHGGLGLHVY